MDRPVIDNGKTDLEVLCKYLGCQGGTVHQLVPEAIACMRDKSMEVCAAIARLRKYTRFG